MTKEFNLVDERWCPVRLHSGETTLLGLKEVFLRSGEISALAETSPPSLVAQYRLMLAITHRALMEGLGHWTVVERARWFRTGLPVELILAYLDKWYDRFWLFHPEHPFMQVAALASAEETRDKCKPWTQIDLASANGNAPMVFDHSSDLAPSNISAEKAFTTLLGFLQFTPGGLVKCLRDADKAGALVNTAAVIPVGATLAGTLCLALHPSNRSQVDADLPCWEREPVTTAVLRSEPVIASGPNDRYTRLSRAVLLLREANGSIRHLRFAAGHALGDDPHAPDPMACFRAGSVGPVRLTFNEGRALWQDMPALIMSSSDGGKIAAVVESAIALHKELAPFESIYQPLLVAGVASDQAKILRWRSEQITLPSVLLREPELALELQERVVVADSLHSELRSLGVSMFAEAMPTSANKETRGRARQMLDAAPFSASYFGVVEQSFPALLLAVAAGDPDRTNELWTHSLRKAAECAWTALLESMGTSSAALRADALYWPKFRRLLNQRMPTTEPSTTPKEISQ